MNSGPTFPAAASTFPLGLTGIPNLRHLRTNPDPSSTTPSHRWRPVHSKPTASPFNPRPTQRSSSPALGQQPPSPCPCSHPSTAYSLSRARKNLATPESKAFRGPSPSPQVKRQRSYHDPQGPTGPGPTRAAHLQPSSPPSPHPELHLN